MITEVDYYPFSLSLILLPCSLKSFPGYHLLVFYLLSKSIISHVNRHVCMEAKLSFCMFICEPLFIFNLTGTRKIVCVINV